jgi:hypothetical protein
MSLAANENRPSAPQTRVNFSLGQRQAAVFLSRLVFLVWFVVEKRLVFLKMRK